MLSWGLLEHCDFCCLGTNLNAFRYNRIFYHVASPPFFLGKYRRVAGGRLVAATCIPVRDKPDGRFYNQNVARCIGVREIKDHLLSAIAKLRRVTEVAHPMAEELGITADPAGGVVS